MAAFSSRPPNFNLAELEALQALKRALLDRNQAKRAVDAPNLSPVAKRATIRRHYAAIQRVIEARSDLDAVLVQSEDL